MKYDAGIKKIKPLQAKSIIDSRQPLGLFYLPNNGVYIGIDNSTGEAWTEEFPNLGKCKRWLGNTNLEMEDIR